MLKQKYLVGSLGALLCLQVAGVETVSSGVVDPCNSVAIGAAGVVRLCPRGDAGSLSAAGLTISVTVLDNVSAPVIGIPAADIWLVGCNDLLTLCGGSGAINASAPTDDNGQTTIDGSMAAGGCDQGVRVVVQGIVVGAGVCADPCVPVTGRSLDINGDLIVNLPDFSAFGLGYTSPPKPYNPCIDYAAVFGVVSLADFALFGAHYNHSC